MATEIRQNSTSNVIFVDGAHFRAEMKTVFPESEISKTFVQFIGEIIARYGLKIAQEKLLSDVQILTNRESRGNFISKNHKKRNEILLEITLKSLEWIKNRESLNIEILAQNVRQSRPLSVLRRFSGDQNPK